MFLTFLEAEIPLTKTYEQHADGTISKTSYPNIWQVTSHQEPCANLKDFESLLKAHAALGHCLLKGEVTRPLVAESRAGTTNRNADTLFLCLDFDGIPANGASVADVEALLTAMGLGDVSYIIQWSGSQNILSRDLRCHVFIMLTKAVAAPVIKQWLIQKNFEVTTLKDCQTLTKTNMSLSWGLDITACQSDKLIYIAPPVLINFSSTNLLGRTPRVQLITKTNPTYDLHIQKVNPITQNRALIDNRVLELRAHAQLPARKITYKQSGAYEVMVKPDECIITEMRQERGYMYFNLNGGDSWGYWHPEDRPEHIFNFKGEPVYLTKDLLPDYWNALKSTAVRTSSTGVQFLAFLDRATSTYWRGTYDPTTDELNLHKAKNETQIRHFCSQYGLLQEDFIPEWTVTFDPHDNTRLDIAAQYINTFQPSPYMKAPPPAKPPAACPPGIAALISHVMCGDAESIATFYNWVAFILQKRERAQTAWVFQGTEGTGKGMLFRRVLRPLFGPNQCNQIRAAQLQEKYNPFMKNALLVFVDEIEAKMFHNDPVGMANLKNYITEDTVELRDLYSSFIKIPNYASIIMSSNHHEPLPLPPNDRRHNVAPRQDLAFKPTDQDLEQIDNELQTFHDFLMAWPVDEVVARTNMKNSARTTLIGLGQTTIESTATALKEGNFREFVDQLPTSTVGHLSFDDQRRIEAYRVTLASIIDRTNPTTGVCSIARDELHVLFSYSSSEMPKTPAKFTKLLGHRQIPIAPTRIDGRTVQGTKVTWQDYPLFTAMRAEFFSDIPVKV